MSVDNENKNVDVCSFCGLPASDGRRLIEGNNCFICETCIGVCYHMLSPPFYFIFLLLLLRYLLQV